MTEKYVQKLLKLCIRYSKTLKSIFKLILTLKTQFENIFMTYLRYFLIYTFT
jgi:hypothetical protein